MDKPDPRQVTSVTMEQLIVSAKAGDTLASVLVGISLGVLGTFVVLRRMAMMTDAISHAREQRPADQLLHRLLDELALQLGRLKVLGGFGLGLQATDEFTAALERTIPGYSDRHRVPGGITGMAQVHGYWGNSSLEERTRLDNAYIDNWSLAQDTHIFLRTIPAMLRKCRRS